MNRLRKGVFRQLIDRLLYGGVWSKLAAVLFVAIVIYYVVALIFVNMFPNHISMEDGRTSDMWQLYYFFADPGSQMSAHYQSDSSRWLGLIMSTLGSIFLSGLLIASINNVFERRSEKWRTGFSYYNLKDHIVIIGSDQMVYGLVSQLIDYTDRYIVVMTSNDVEHMRNSLYANLKNKRDRNRIIVNYGVRDSESNLCAINVVHAHEVYVLGDSSESDGVESCHDSLNVQCLTIIAKLCKAANRKSLPCNVLFDYKTTYHIFQYANLTSEVTDYVDFHPFNFYDFWARKVLVSGYSAMDNISYQPLDYIPITSKESDKYVHLIIIGMSQMGQAMALQAAHIAHFPNYKKRKTKITFIDRNGKLEMGEFKQKCGELFKVSKSTYIDADAWSEAEERWSEGDSPIDESRYITNYGIAPEYQYLVNDDEPDVVDVEWQFIKGDDHNPVVQRLLAGYASEEDAIVTVAVCLNLMHTSLRSAMHLPKPFYEREAPIPILVQQRKTSTIASTVNGVGFSDEERSKLLYRNIVPFGMVYDCYDLHLAASLEVCKRVNALYDYYFAHNELPSVIDADKSEALWRALPITKQWSNVFVAASVPTKLRSIGIDWSITNPTKLAPLKDSDVALLTEMEHNRWNVEELLMGYRPVKSDEDKAIDADKSLKKQYRNRFIHYDIRPYGCLKEDATGRNSSVYDEVIVRALPLILNELAKNRE